MAEQITVTMPLQEWEQSKKRIEAEALESGKTEGHQSVWRFIRNAMTCPNEPVMFGKGFPDDLRDTVSELVEWTRTRKK